MRVTGDSAKLLARCGAGLVVYGKAGGWLGLRFDHGEQLSVRVPDELLPEGEFLGPDHIHTPGIYVQHLVRADPGDKRIEQRTVRPRGEG